MTRFIRLTSLIIMMGSSIACTNPKLQADYQVIPLPQEITAADGEGFVLKDGTKVFYLQDDAMMENCAASLCRMTLDRTAIKLIPVGIDTLLSEEQDAPFISLVCSPEVGKEEAYHISVSSEKTVITGSDPAGAFHAIQTILKSLPAVRSRNVLLPAVEISDWPRFRYRGMMLDVSRHFFSTQEVKEFIDLLAMHQMNVFHWHLTDDQGWRIQINRYPELTGIGSKRAQTVIGHNTDEYDGLPYGGFYTQEEIRDIVKYAAERFITIIPEIDMPGHMMGALSAMPELGCTGGLYLVWERWGVSDDVLCAGNEKSLQFVKNVLDEVMELFPSPYIHLGGDECLKNHWKECPECQSAIRRLGLDKKQGQSPENLLQSYFMTAVEDHLHINGRQMIGWDEILEGELPDRATVMAWRGTERGIEAVRKGHDVIMTPTSHFYFDFYQSQERKDEPLAIGGYLPLEQVYSFEPSDFQLTEEEMQHILGVQANVWTEYIASKRHLQYMILPRMDALSEVQWCRQENRDFRQFTKRLGRMLDWYDAKGINHADHLLDVRIRLEAVPEDRKVQVTLESLDGAEIHYTVDGTDPSSEDNLYTAPFFCSQDRCLKAIATRNGKTGKVSCEEIRFSKASYCPVELSTAPNPRFTFRGASQLVDGITGDKSITSGRWIGFNDRDVIATIDLERSTEISQVTVGTILSQQDWVFDARSIEVALSENGKVFQQVARLDLPSYTLADKDGSKRHQLRFTAQKARYIQVTIRPEHCIPACHCGKGSEGFIFIDEIEID